MKVCETFQSFQGEISIGRYAFFIRLAKCNLACVFCDTPYAKEEYVDIDIDTLVQQAMHFPCVIITGGEPFLQREDIAKFVKKLYTKNPDIDVEIETNGTIRPVSLTSYNVKFNVSLKMKNSGNKYDDRIKPEVVNWFNQAGANFKFVVTNQDDVDEVDLLVKDFGIKKKQVYLMPEGKTTQEQIDKMDNVLELAKIHGYNFSPRFQVLMWGNKRGV